MLIKKSYRVAASAVLFMAVILMIIFSYSNYNLRADHFVGGYLDLSTQDLQNTIYSLDGNWTFYPGEFIEPMTIEPDAHLEGKIVEKSSISTIAEEIKVPGSLYQLSMPDDKLQTGTYRLKIRLKESGAYALKVSNVSGAYKLYCNGEWIGGVGEVGTTRETERSVWQPKIYLLDTQTDLLDIVIQVSNFNCRHGGLIKSLYFGTIDNIQYFQIMQIIKSATIIGIFLGLGVYLLLLTHTTSHRKSGLCLGIFCVGSALLESLLDENIFSYFIKDLPLLIPMKGQFIACMILVTAVFYFHQYIYPLHKWRFLSRIVEVFNLIYLVLLFAAPSYSMASAIGGLCTVFLILNLIPHLLQIVHAIRHMRRYAYLSLLSIIVLFVLSCLQFYFVDTGKSLHLYTRENLFIIGILFFILCQINILLTDVDRAYQNAKLADTMEIAYLQAQISPHFMFNTLNNVVYFLETDPKKAKKLLLSFCDFLKVKHKYDFRKQVFHTLLEELDFLESYIAIENIRYQDQITLITDVPEHLMSMKIMPLLLQPLVENAIKHGYDAKPMTIEIAVTETEEDYLFWVKDNGKGMNPIVLRKLEENKSKGVGISNINYRLEKYCGNVLHFESTPDEGTTITFRYAKRILN